MGVENCLAKQEYTHVYQICKSISTYDCIWLQCNAHFQEAYMHREGHEQRSGAIGCESANNVKHGKMEDDFMIFALDTAARDATFTKLMKTSGNLSTQFSQEEDQIRAFQAKLCNLKVAVETRYVDVKNNKTGQPFAQHKKKKISEQQIWQRRSILTKINVVSMDTTQATRTCQKGDKGEY